MGRLLRAIAVTAVVVACGNPYEGDSAPPKIVVSTTTVDFGVVACGGDAPTVQSFAVRNEGGTPLTWSAALSDSAQFSISGPSSGTVAPGAEATVTIASRPVPPEAAAAVTLSAVLTITTNDPEAPSVDALAQLVTGGGMIEMVPQSISFGEWPVGVAAFETPTVLRNTGNQPIDIRIDPPANPTYSIASNYGAAPITTTLAPGEAVPGLVGGFTPIAAGPTSTSAAITVTGALCGTRPSAIELSGTGSSSGVGLHPGLLDFGLVACGTAAKSQVITLTSSATGPAYTFSAKLAKGASSRFTVSPESGSVPIGGSQVITVTPLTIPTTGGIGDNLYGDVLTVSTSAPGDSEHEIPLRMSPYGAIFAVAPGLLDFGNVNTNGSGRDRSIHVANVGNMTGSISFSVEANAFNVRAPSTLTLGPSGTGSVVVRAKPQGTGNKTGWVVPSTTARICSPLPPAVQVTCRGT